jgi:hypothetical protein
MLLVADTLESITGTGDTCLAPSRSAGGTSATPTWERRRGLRVRQSRPVKVFEPSLSRYFGGRTEDISSTGLRLELPTSAPLRAGSVINVHVGLSESGQSLAHRRHMIPAKVVWIDRSATRGAGMLSAGIEFVASTAAHLDAA